MSTRNTDAPWRASNVAVALPLPQPGPIDPAPVTIATLSFMLSMLLSPSGRGSAPARAASRALRHSSKRCSTTKNDGTNSTARHVDAIMPLNTARPSETRALAPAPVAVTSGTTPRMNANDVIRIGRKRTRAASTAA